MNRRAQPAKHTQPTSGAAPPLAMEIPASAMPPTIIATLPGASAVVLDSPKRRRDASLYLRRAM